MGAIFQHPMDYMTEPLNMFESYMEKASLQLRVELEEYVESTSSTSSSIFITEGAETFLEKFKKAIKLIIERIKEFIRDTKMNFEKYKRDKASEEKIDKLASVLKKSEKLESLKVKYKDYSPKAKFIKSQKEALKRMIRKEGTTVEELKIFMDRYSKELTTMQKVSIVAISVTAVTIVSKAFLKGLTDGFNSAMGNATDDIDGLNNLHQNSFSVNESTDNKSVVTETDLMTAYAKAIAEICTDEIKVQREIIEEFDKALSFVESEVKKYLGNMEGDDE